MKTARWRSRGQCERAEHYRALLEKQATSELSVREFAREVGVSAATLYLWRRRLAESHGTNEVGGLVEVQVTGDSAVMRRGAAIVLTVDERLRIELEADFDDKALARLLQILSRC